MKLQRIAAVSLICIALFITANNCFAMDEVPLTEQEKCEAQQAAQHFVKRMQKTRDVSLLFEELFLPDFISHFVSDADESISASLYSQLTQAERRRLFIVQINGSYLITLDVKSGTTDNYPADKSGKSAFKNILPAAMAERLRNVAWREGELQFSDYQDFQSRLPKIEGVLSEARTYLIKRGIEQTPKFQRSLDDTITGEGINYRVRAYVGSDEIQDCEPLGGFPANQKFFRVETPLFLGVILVKDGNRMRIVRLTVVDGD